MEARSGKRKRTDPSKSLRRTKIMTDDDNADDYLDFLSQMGNGNGVRNNGEEDTSYLHDESLLLSPVLIDYVNRSSISSSTDGCGPNGRVASFKPIRYSEEDGTGGQINDGRSRDDNASNSSPVRRENLHSVWQLDASTCPSLGLGSTTSADTSQDISGGNEHIGIRDPKKLLSDSKENEISEDCTYKIPERGDHENKRGSLGRENNNSTHGSDRLPLVDIEIHSNDTQNCKTNDDKGIQKCDDHKIQVDLSCKDTKSLVDIGVHSNDTQNCKTNDDKGIQKCNDHKIQVDLSCKDIEPLVDIEIHSNDTQNCKTNDDKKIQKCNDHKIQVDLSCKVIDDGSVRSYEEMNPEIVKNQVACDEADNPVITKLADDSSPLEITSNQSGCNTSMEAPNAWFSRLSSVVPHARVQKESNCNPSDTDSGEGQASDHEKEDKALHTKPQHNLENEETADKVIQHEVVNFKEFDHNLENEETTDKVIQHEVVNFKDLKGCESWSTPSSDNSDLDQSYSEQQGDSLPSPPAHQSLQHEETNNIDKMKSGDRNKSKIQIPTKIVNDYESSLRSSPTVGSPKSKVTHDILADSIKTDCDGLLNEKDGLVETLSRTWKTIVEKMTPSKKSMGIRWSPALTDSDKRRIKSYISADESKDALFPDDSKQVSNQHLDHRNTASPIKPISDIDLSLTPALKRLRSRMEKSSEDNLDIPNNSGDLNEKHIKFEDQVDDCVRTPTNAKTETVFDCIHTPTTVEKSINTNLTPALQALKSRIDLYSSDEDYNTPHSLNTTRSSQKGSGISTRRSPILPLDEDDSYLEQPNDLSSAKKKLTAQSSALVERLRGASQRRKMQLSRSRNSIAATEQRYLMTLETNDDLIYSPDVDCGEIDEEAEIESPVIKTPYRAFKARPLPATTLGGSGGQSGVPKVNKRPTTTPKSPMLGFRRVNTTETKAKDNCRSIRKETHRSNNSKQAVGKSPAYDPTKTRQTPASTGSIKFDVPRRASKTRQRTISVPNTPCVSLQKKDVKPTKSILLSAAARVNVKSNRNNERTDPKKQSYIGQDTKSYSGQNTHMGQHQYMQTGSKADQENIASFRLHSAIRAEERAKFDTLRISSEKKRQEQLNKDRETLIKEKHLELSRLKESLR